MRGAAARQGAAPQEQCWSRIAWRPSCALPPPSALSQPMSKTPVTMVTIAAKLKSLGSISDLGHIALFRARPRGLADNRIGLGRPRFLPRAPAILRATTGAGRAERTCGTCSSGMRSSTPMSGIGKQSWPFRAVLKAQYDLSIGLMQMSVTSAVQGSDNALTTTLAISSGCRSTSG